MYPYGRGAMNIDVNDVQNRFVPVKKRKSSLDVAMVVNDSLFLQMKQHASAICSDLCT